MLIVLLTAAGCSGYDAVRSATPAAVSYSAEPFPILRVDRSKFAQDLWPVDLPSPYAEPPGTIVIDTANHHLYLIKDSRMARRYGVAVGEGGKAWSGRAVIGRKAHWPAWHPTDDMHSVTPGLPRRIAPGLENPLGARALYLFQSGRDTLYRIHGTSEPWTIGTDTSSGCIRMLNEDVVELYDTVVNGAVVVVL